MSCDPDVHSFDDSVIQRFHSSRDRWVNGLVVQWFSGSGVVYVVLRHTVFSTSFCFRRFLATFNSTLREVLGIVHSRNASMDALASFPMQTGN